MTAIPITAIVLCGGAAERLGGVDKPLQPLAGRPPIERVLGRIRPQVQAIIISANRSVEHYRHHGYPLVDDGRHSGCGPLAGLAAGLAIAKTTDVLCVPGDAPCLPADLAARLARARAASGARVAVVNDGSGLQPLCALLPRDLLPSLAAFLDNGGRAAHRWIEAQQPAVTDCSDWPRWAWSVNTAEEWTAAEQHLASESLP